MKNNAEDGGMYSIRIRERIDENWSDWFGDMQISPDRDGTVLTGHVPDQAALHGVLATLQRLGLSLVAVNRQEKV